MRRCCRCETLLEEGQPLGNVVWTADEIETINERMPGTITTKPVVYLINVDKKSFIKVSAALPAHFLLTTVPAAFS